MTVLPTAPISAGLVGAPLAPEPFAAPRGATTSFAQMLADGVGGVEAKVETADRTVRAFALDDSIPVHQVSYAIEQARLSLEMMLQVRNRLVEGYQQLMNMQL